MLPSKKTSAIGFALLVTFLTPSKPFGASSTHPAVAQTRNSTTVPLPVPSGMMVRIAGSGSAAVFNQGLKQRFETRFPGTTVAFNKTDTPAALQALHEGNVDLVAIGRSLTAAERAQGLVAVPVTRGKIAIIVSKDNPFKGNITTTQFAQIFRGKITNWSQLGGSRRAIRFVDQPKTSDTREALRNYPVFKGAAFQTGKNATQVRDDSIQAVVQKLGKNGISYMSADQAAKQPGVRIVTLHNTTPTQPRYPFSQPFYYVYKRTPSPVVAVFLDHAIAPQKNQAVKAAQSAKKPLAAGSANFFNAAISSPNAASPAPSEIASAPRNATTAATRTAQSGLPGWLLWLFPLGIGGLLLAWFLRKRRLDANSAPEEFQAPFWLHAPTPPTPSTPAASTQEEDLGTRAGSVINADRAADEAQSHSRSIPEPSAAPLVESLSSEVDPTLNEDRATIDPSSISQNTVNLQTGTARGVTIATDAAAAAWVARPEANAPSEPSTPEEIAHGTSDLPTPAEVIEQPDGSITFHPTDPPTEKTEDPLTTFDLLEFDLMEEVEALETQVADAENTVELNLDDASSAIDTTIDTTDEPPAMLNTLGGAAITGAAVTSVVGMSAFTSEPLELREANLSQSDIEATKYDVGQTDLSSETLATVDEGLPDLPDGYGESRIILMPRDPQSAYAYWDIPNEPKEALRRQGGQNLILRLCDVTDIDLAHQSPHNLQQFDCDELARDWHLPIPMSDRDYLVEIGYLTAEGGWLLLARSAPVRIPPVYPSDWVDDQFATIDWNEDLRDKTLPELIPPTKRTPETVSIYNQLFGLAQGTESQRIAGSLFGSMQQVPQSAISSFVFPSGIGNLPTPSGMGMSGINLSGLHMSGIGFSASAPPIRPRNFWLVADAELIVYGATEPDATVTIAGQPVKLNSDGTFRFQMSFQDGLIDYPIMAIAKDGEQIRFIHLKFNRETPGRHTNTKDAAIDEWFS